MSICDDDGNVIDESMAIATGFAILAVPLTDDDTSDFAKGIRTLREHLCRRKPNGKQDGE